MNVAILLFIVIAQMHFCKFFKREMFLVELRIVITDCHKYEKLK